MSNDKTPAEAAAIQEYPPRPYTNVPVHDLNGGNREAFLKGAAWQASQSSAAPVGPTIDRIMEVVEKVLSNGNYLDPVFDPKDLKLMDADLRKRLSSLFK